MSKKRFHRHFKSGGIHFYWILFAYLILGWFFPIIGWVAIICMLGPVLTSIWRGRWWCGHVCPRGNMYDRLLSKYSPHRPIPKFVRTFGFRLFMVFLIFAMFGVQMYFAWGDWASMGFVFWKIILITTVVGVVLSFIYAPRTWCSFCPMGTISSWVAPKHMPFPKGFKRVLVASDCEMKCKNCARFCPMQLTPYDAKGDSSGYLHPDCLKCGRCINVCPTKIVKMKKEGDDASIDD